MYKFCRKDYVGFELNWTPKITFTGFKDFHYLNICKIIKSEKKGLCVCVWGGVHVLMTALKQLFTSKHKILAISYNLIKFI